MPPSKTLPPRLAGTLGLLLGVGGLLTLLVVWLGWRYVRDSREAAVRLAEVQTRNLVQSIEGSVSATLLRVDMVLQMVVDEAERSSSQGSLDPVRVGRFIEQAQFRLPEAVAIRVTDAQGHVIVGNPGTDGRATFEDRPFWIPLKEGTHQGRYLTPPILGKFTGRWVITSARRYNGPGGVFAGVVVVPVFLEHFQKVLEGYDVGAAGALTLRDAELGFIARFPRVLKGQTRVIGDRNVSQELRDLVKSGHDSGTFRTTTPFDQTTRIFSFRRVSGAPMLVLAGLADEDYLAPWRSQRLRAFGLVGMALATLWAALLSIHFFWKRHCLDEAIKVKTQAELRLNASRLREAAALAHLGHWEEDHGAGTVWWSEDLYRIHGMDPGQGPPTFERFLDHVLPEDREGVQTTYQVHLGSPSEATRATYRIQTEGGVRFIQTRYHTERDASGQPTRTFGTDQDISDQAQAAQALRESEQRFNTAFEHMPMALGIGRLRDGQLLMVNKAFEVLTGFSREELLGRPSRQGGFWVDPEDRTRIVEAVTAQGSVQDVEIQIRCKDGTVVPVSYSGTIVALDGEPCLLSGSVDLSARKRAEEQAQHYQRQLFQSQKLESLGGLAGGVAHDMNNVLAAILGMASVVAEWPDLDPPLARAMDTITKASERGRTLVQGLLGFARQGLETWTVVDLNPLVLEQVSILERTTFQRIRVQTDLMPEPCHLRGDASALSHMLMNLCVNAVDAMAEGGTLSLRTRKEGRDWICLEVVDTGVGMRPEVLAKALDPFFTTKPMGKGTGLGLAIVYGTVQAHHGQVSLDSAPGRGTTVTIRLPAAPVEAAQEVPASAPVPLGRKLRVLLVDDDECVRDSGRLLLEVLGHHLTTAERGQRALDLFVSEGPFDVVILDVNMPGMTGLEVAPRLLETHPNLAIFLATGRVDQAVLDAAETYPSLRIFPKPYTLQDLREALAKV